VEDGKPYFANSVAEKFARLRNSVSGLLNTGNGARVSTHSVLDKLRSRSELRSSKVLSAQ
jgi:hypothetical protein